MKKMQILVNSLVACSVALAMVSTLAAQTMVEGTAKVVRIKGPARYTTGGNEWHPLKLGAVLKPGTMVQTGKEAGSFVDLVLGDVSIDRPATYKPSIPSSYMSSSFQPSAAQNVVRLWENTAMGIDKLSSMQTGMETVTDTQLDLRSGKISGSVKKMTAASKYEIKLPNGVAGIRGTNYRLTAEGVFEILDGSGVIAVVDPKTGKVVTQVVGGGQQYDASTGVLSPISAGNQQTLDQIFTSMKFVQNQLPTSTANSVAISKVSPGKGKGKGKNQ